MQVGKQLGEFFVKNDLDFAPALFPKIAQLLGGRKTPIPAPYCGCIVAFLRESV
jgi:hypothetical protein